MPTALPARNIFDGTAAPVTSAMKTALGSLRDYLASLIGTTGAAVDARAALGAAAVYGVRGLAGINNAATPLTKYDLTSADAVTLRDATGGTVTRYAATALTCDFGVTGSLPNGRDQVAAFAASNWVHLYYVWNGTTLATLASLALPSVGPLLPTGYTHWCYATTCRWNGSSNIVRQRSQGHTVWYELDEAGSVLSAGVATAFVALNLATWIPPNTVLVTLEGYFSATHNNAGSAINSYIKPDGSALAGNANIFTTAVFQVASISSTALGYLTVPVSSSQQVDYKLSATPNVSGGLYVDVHSYTIPNGDA